MSTKIATQTQVEVEREKTQLIIGSSHALQGGHSSYLYNVVLMFFQSSSVPFPGKVLQKYVCVQTCLDRLFPTSPFPTPAGQEI